MPIRLGHAHIVNFKITFWFIISETDPCTFIFFSLFSGLFVFISPPFPPCFFLLVTLVSRYPFCQLSFNHNMDVPDKDVHYPVRYRLYTALDTQLQYSSQIIETETVSLEFSLKFLTFTLHTFVLSQMCPSSSPVLSHVYFGDHCNSQIYIGEGEMHTSFSTFLTGIVLIPSHYQKILPSNYRKTANQSTRGVMRDLAKIVVRRREWVKL